MNEADAAGGVTGSAATLMEASPVPVLVHDPETGAILDANPAGESLFGHDVEQLREMSVAEFSPSVEEASAQAEAAFAEAVTSGEADLDWEITHPDGTTTAVHVALRHRSLDGRELIFAFVTDVSGLRKRERILDGLHDVARELLDATTVDRVAEITTRAAEHVMQTPLASVRFREGDLLVPASITPEARSKSGSGSRTESVDDNFIGETFQGEEPRIFSELDSADRKRGSVEIRSAICVPLGSHGVFTIGDEAPDRFDEADLEIATLLTQLTTAALDQIKREERLAERTRQLETLLNNAPVIFYELQPDGTITESRGQGLDALGLEPGEAVGVNAYEMYGDVADVEGSLDRALDGERVSQTIQLGSLWLENTFQPVFDDDGTVERVVGVAFDVSELKQLESQFADLSASAIELADCGSREHALETAMDIVESVLDEPVAVYWRADRDAGRLVADYVSDGAETLTSASDGPLVHAEGDPVWQVFEAGEPILDNEFEPADTADPAPLKSVVMAPVGEHGLLTVGSTESDAYHERTRQLLSILAGMLRTSLDRLAYEHQLERHQEELERSNESLQQFAYVASHDLQEPLRMVSSYVSLLEAEYGDALDAEAQEYVDFAVDGAARMKELIDALLDYSRVQTKGSDFEPVDANGVLADVERRLELLIEDRDARIERESLPVVSADPSQLAQVFQNLVSNAIEHGGDSPTVTISAQRSGDMVRFDVSDDGPGIEPDQHERIFKLFEQGSRERGGTGIGLAMCKRIAQRHGGDVWVDSEPGEGATFSFTMPIPKTGGGEVAVV